MEMPIMLKREKMMKNLLNVINEAQLPPLVVAPILSDLLAQTNVMIQRQYDEEKARYEKSLKEAKEG